MAMLRTHLLRFSSRIAGQGTIVGMGTERSATAGCLRYAMATTRTTMHPCVSSYSTAAGAKVVSSFKKRSDTGKARSGEKVVAAAKVSIEDLWNQLDTYYKQNNILRYEHCERLLQQLEARRSDEEQSLSAGQLHFLLGACVPELMPVQRKGERLHLFRRFWAQLLKVEQPSLAHYHTQLQMLRQNQLPLLDHRALLAEITVYNEQPDANLYSALLDVAGASGNMRQATELLSEMRDKHFSLTERNFHALLLGHARSGDLAGVEAVLSNMRAASILPNATTQSLCFVAYVENGQLAKARDLLKQHTFNAPQLLQMLRAVVGSKEVDTQLVKQLVAELPSEYVSDVDVPPAINSLCIQLLHSGQTDLMTQLVATLPVPKYNEKQNTDGYAVLLLQELFRAHIPIEQMLQFANQLRQSGQNARALQVLTELALRRQPSLAMSCLDALSAAGEPLRPHYFWPLVLYQHKQEGEAGVLRLLGEMKRLRVECDEATLRLYVLPNLWQTLQQPLQALQQLDTVGVRASQVMSHVLTQLLQQQQVSPALDLLQRYPTRLQLSTLMQPVAAVAVQTRATKKYALFAQLVQALQQRSLQRRDDFVGALLLQMCAPQTRLRQEPAALLRFIHEMQRLELQVSAAAAESILSVASSSDVETREAIAKALQKMRSKELTLAADAGGHDGFIKHPRDMSLDELERHLIELEAKQMNARGVLRRLLQLNVRDNRLERALVLQTKCEKLNVQISPGMLAAIFDLHIKLKNLPRAEQSLKRLQNTYPGE